TRASSGLSRDPIDAAKCRVNGAPWPVKGFADLPERAAQGLLARHHRAREARGCMTSAWLWIVSLVVGTAVVSFSATLGQPAHRALTSLSCPGFTVLPIMGRPQLDAAGGREPPLASATA